MTLTEHVDGDRLVRTFLELLAIHSPSGIEPDAAPYREAAAAIRSLGYDVVPPARQRLPRHRYLPGVPEPSGGRVRDESPPGLPRTGALPVPRGHPQDARRLPLTSPAASASGQADRPPPWRCIT
jgi:hypothetical protein